MSNKQVQVQVSFTLSILLIVCLIAIGFVIDNIGGVPKIIRIFTGGETSSKISFSIAFTGIITLIAMYRQFLLKTIISTRFAITLLLVIALLTILGTLIIQDEIYETYLNVYGKNISDWIFKLNLNNIFHSYYFGILLATMACSLILVTIKRKPFKLTQIGFTLTHTGTVLILIGGLIGVIWGEKGYIHLTKGKPSNVMKVIQKGKEVGDKNLNFTVSLEDFKVEYYDEGDKISVYERENQDYKYLFSINPATTKEFKLPGGIRTIRIIKKDIYESQEEKVQIPYFEIEVERPQNSQKPKAEESPNSPHHGIDKEMFGSGPVSLILAMGNPLPFESNRYVISYNQRKEPKLFQSILSISDNSGKKITSPPIIVNAPFTYKGYKFYQSNYNPENPNYSGILLVKDPGLLFVYIGFVLICIGVIYIFYIKPKIIENIRLQSITNLEQTNPIEITT